MQYEEDDDQLIIPEIITTLHEEYQNRQHDEFVVRVVDDTDDEDDAKSLSADEEDQLNIGVSYKDVTRTALFKQRDTEINKIVRRNMTAIRNFLKIHTRNMEAIDKVILKYTDKIKYLHNATLLAVSVYDSPIGHTITEVRYFRLLEKLKSEL